MVWKSCVCIITDIHYKLYHYIVDGKDKTKFLTAFAKAIIIDVSQGSEYLPRFTFKVVKSLSHDLLELSL